MATLKKRSGGEICFVSTIFSEPWGGCEELWSRTAVELVSRGLRVSASVREWSSPHPRILTLIENGVRVWFRPQTFPVREHAWRLLAAPQQILKHAWRFLTAPQKTATTTEVERLLAAGRPRLMVICEAGAFPPVDLLELCIDKRIPFVTIHQANSDGWWVDDHSARRYRAAFSSAQNCFFVSEGNQRLLEKQIGCELSNAEVVWNPINVNPSVSLAWPRLGREHEFRFACVARLEPPAKGQDILLEALAGPPWAARRWRLTLYGEGPMRDGLRRLARRLGLSDRVAFAGFDSVENIWASNHALIMPSRFEGLPLAMVEAMWCARPVVATNVAGHAEVIEEGVTGFLADAPTVTSLNEALERFWARRHDAELIGEAGAKRIRRLVPHDPVQDFADKLMSMVDPHRHKRRGIATPRERPTPPAAPRRAATAGS